MKKQNLGFGAKTKFAFQIAAALTTGTLVCLTPEFSTRIAVPFFKNFQPDLGWGYVPFAVLVIVGSLAFGALSVSEEERLTTDLGLAGMSLFSVVIAILSVLSISADSTAAKGMGWLRGAYLP